MIKKIKKKIDFKLISYKFIFATIFFSTSIALFLSLLTYNAFDPSPFSVGDDEVTNILGKFGASLSAIIIFIYGKGSWLLVLGFLFLTRLFLITKSLITFLLVRIISLFLSIFAISLSFSFIGLDPGGFGEALVQKLSSSLLNYDKSFEKYILLANLVVFSFVFFITISKSIKSFLSSINLVFQLLLKSFFDFFWFIFSNANKKKTMKINDRTSSTSIKKVKIENENFNLPLFIMIRMPKIFRKSIET